MPTQIDLPKATLVDLLDRVLDRGLVINADIIICLSGVPLIGINLRTALAGIETMRKYGFMRDWDNEIRAQPATPAPTVASGQDTIGQTHD